MPTDTPAYVDQLEHTVRDAERWLMGLPEQTLRWRPAATAWSIKEIIGHLIDSAANNHQRFVRAETQDDLVFGGYAQEHWVRAQRYDDAPWNDLVQLWTSYNRHLARVMAAVPETVRNAQRARHNLHEIGWRPFDANQPATLDHLMHDYVLHLEHHLSQVRDRVRGAEAAAGT
jgi:hypothetical protein